MAATKKSRLGRGLGALITDIDEVVAEPSKEVAAAASEIDVNLIDVFKDQPRKKFDEEALSELAESIKIHGVIQPLILKKRGERYSIIAGERRYRAARKAGLKTVPAIMKDIDEKEILELSIIENIQREDLDAIEEANAIAMLMKEYSLTQEQAAERLGKSRSAVANTLRLIKLPAAVRDMVASGELSAGHARCLVPLSAAQAEKAAEVIVSRRLSVRETEEYVKKLTSEPQKKPAKKESTFKDAEFELSRRYDTKVRIAGSEQKGKITIEYKSKEQLEALYDMLAKK